MAGVGANFQIRNFRRVVISVGLLLGSVLVIVALTCRSFETKLANGTFILITPASTLASFCCETSSRIDCRTKGGNRGTITLLQDSDSCLAMVMPGAEGDELLILYYADVHYRLMRIDPTKPSSKFQNGSYLNYIVLTSPWSIEEGTSNDWEEVHSYLKAVPQDVFDRQACATFDLGVVRQQFQRGELLSEVEREIYNSQRGWVY